MSHTKMYEHGSYLGFEGGTCCNRSSMVKTKTTLYDEDQQVDESKIKMNRINQTKTTQ